ncbi:hypothetical protein AXF42_Ash004550 [Apostasia shenzhenica]|uniref:Uncharacterized protein n=1 Tax=Apostasia shenzhenica TaxID=1088818 RepID=A0A2I0BGZ3_9ASPA|nr:hypothetical protein AXF42_Ash004550 [Apostasia shenzhenica]
MRAVKGEITSSRPISLSKAAAVLSRFASSDSGARPDVAAYLRRAASAFDELVAAHREIRAPQKMSRLEENEYEDDSRQKKNGADYGAAEAGEECRFTAPIDEAKVVREVKEEGKVSRFSTEAELNGFAEQEEKKDKKNELKGKNYNKVEAEGEEFERDGKGSVERRRKKEKKREDGREEEAAKKSLEVKYADMERKKRKNFDAAQERLSGELDQEDGHRKKRKRKAD